MEEVRIEQHSFMGSVWLAALPLTLVFLHLTFWKGVLALLFWPNYLGLAFAK